MADILKWLGNTAKGVGRQLNTFDNGATFNKAQSSGPVPGSIASQVNQKIVQPLQRNAVQPVAQAVPKVFNQVNPFDNGRTYQNNNPMNNRSILGQLSHNGITNQAGNLFVKPTIGLGSQAYHTVAALGSNTNALAAALTNNQEAYQNAMNAVNADLAPGRAFLNSQQAQQGGTQLIRPVLSAGTQIAPLFVGNAAAGLTDKVGASLIEKGASKGAQVAAKTGINALAGGALNTATTASQQLINDGRLNPSELAKQAALGAALSIGGDLAHEGVSKLQTSSKQAAKNVKPLSEEGSLNIGQIAGDIKNKLTPKYNGLRKEQVIMDGRALSDLKSARDMLKAEFAKNPDDKYTPSVPERQAMINTLHDIKNQYGHNFITGDNASRVQKIDQFMAQNEGAIPKIQSSLMGNNVGSVGKDVRPDNVKANEIITKANNENRVITPAEEAIIKNQTKVKSKSPSIPTSAPTPKIGVSEAPKLSTKDYVAKQTKLQEEAAGNKSRFSGVGQALNTKMVDALNPIQKPITKALGGTDKAYKLRDSLDRSLKSDTIGGQFTKDNGFHEIVKNLDDTKAFDQYVLAKHSADLESNGIKTGRNAAQDTQLVKDLSPKYEAQAKALTEYNNKLLNKTVDYGLISKETATYLKQKYPNYVPFDRIFSDAEMQNMKGNGAGPASLSTQTVVQRIKGSERQVQSPLESILAKTHDVIAQGERNQAAKTVIASKDLPGNPLALRELKPGEKLANRPSISYLDNGVKKTFLTTPEVAAAAKSLNKEQMNVVQKILSYPTRTLRLGATGINVGFALANVAKDTASSFINSKHPLESSIANPKVFMKALDSAFRHKGSNYAELVREGAGGTSFDIARGAAKDTIEKIRAEKNTRTKVLYTVKHPGELLRAVEDTIGRSEEFGRAMQYYGNKEAALKAGKSASDAVAYGADAARNNTINFARAGEYGRVLNSVLPYFNAGIQGSRTFLTNLKEHPAQTGAKVAITAFLPVAATTSWNLNDPKRKEAYDDIQEYEKQGNIIIVPPNPHKDASGRWNVIKIPVSQEVANLNNVVRNGVETLHKDASFNFAGMAGDLAGTATSINLQSPRQTIGQVTPQAIKPAVEALTNQNLFTGNKIVPDKLKNLDAKDQVGKNTSGTAKTIGKVAGVSPLHVDNFLKTSLGGAGQNAVNFSDQALAKLGVIKPEDVKGRTLEQSITNRFTSAQGKSEYSAIDKTFSDASTKLKSLPGYKSLSTDEKAKALNRLQGDVVKAQKLTIDAENNTGQYAQDYVGKQTKLSPKQAGLLNGKTDISTYLTASTSLGGKATVINDGINSTNKKILSTYDKLDTAARNKYFNGANDNEYKYQQAKYENDTANGTLSKAQDARAKYDLMQAKVGSGYSKETRDLYGLSKTQLYSVLKADPNGGGIAKQVAAYGDALENAGLSNNKFRDSKGNISFSKEARGTGSGRRGRKSGGLTALKAVKAQKIPKMPSFKTPKFRVASSKVTAYKAPKLPYNGVSVKTPKVTRKAIA